MLRLTAGRVRSLWNLARECDTTRELAGLDAFKAAAGVMAVPGAVRAATTRAFTALPIIDVSALWLPDQDAAAKAQVGRQLHEACRDVGFFYVTNHGMPSDLQTGILREAREWFLLPEAIKRKILLTPSSKFRGYQPLGANVTRYDGGFQRDWHEAIDLYRDDQGSTGPPSPLHGTNQWPNCRPQFDAMLRRYITSCLQLGETLMRGIAGGLGLPERTFEHGTCNTTAGTSYWVARIIHYPPLSSAPALRAEDGGHGEIERSVQLSCGEHTDYGMLTLVNQEQGVTALQVRNAVGEWVSAPPIPGTFVCNVGDMLKVWTGGLYEPTAHRVVNPDPARSRVSLPFFYEPAFETVVAPLPGLLSVNSASHAPVRYGTHLEHKVLSNFELDAEGTRDAGVGGGLKCAAG